MKKGEGLNFTQKGKATASELKKIYTVTKPETYTKTKTQKKYIKLDKNRLFTSQLQYISDTLSITDSKEVKMLLHHQSNNLEYKTT